MTDARKAALLSFCKSVNISFHDLSLLDRAFFHRSITNEEKFENNERMEFLGDSVLGLVCAEYLYKSFQDFPEGELAKIKSIVVSEKSLSAVARSLKVDSLLVLGHGEELSGGRNKDAILADCMEAVIGSYFLDGGYEKAYSFVTSFLKAKVLEALEHKGAQDWKSLLQVLYQKETKTYPIYETVETKGAGHDMTFKVTVRLKNEVFGPASGKSKKEAEQKAAELAYKKMTEV